MLHISRTELQLFQPALAFFDLLVKPRAAFVFAHLQKQVLAVQRVCVVKRKATRQYGKSNE
jgi:hypothetical protein